jgi:transcription antitermination factor NusG
MSKFKAQRHWYAVHTRSNFEQTVASFLDARAIEVYYPAFEETHRWADRRKVVNCAAFPGYLFVRIDGTAEERLMVLESRGAVRILGIGGAIEPVPDYEIEAIRRMLANNTLCSRHDFLQEGMRVRVRRGALKGLTGILVRLKNRTRIVVAVQLLQQAISADIDAHDVEALHGPEQGDAITVARPFGAHHSH